MRPLILRPHPQAEALASQLRRAGHDPVVRPLLEVIPGRELSDLPEHLAHHPWLIAISAAAVEQAQRWLQSHQLNWPPTPTFAVGQATAEAWLQAGRTARYPDDARSEGILALPEMTRVAGQRVLILRGDGGREWLAEQLRARGARVTYCECYQRHWLPLDGQQLCSQWRTAGVDSVIISSGELLRRLLSLLPEQQRDWWQQWRFIVPSHRVAELVLDAGLPAPTIATGASHSAFCQALGHEE